MVSDVCANAVGETVMARHTNDAYLELFMLSISSPFSWHAAKAAGHLSTVDDAHTNLRTRSLRAFRHILQIDRTDHPSARYLA
jgi:hypothetical protein